MPTHITGKAKEKGGDQGGEYLRFAGARMAPQNLSMIWNEAAPILRAPGMTGLVSALTLILLYFCGYAGLASAHGLDDERSRRAHILVGFYVEEVLAEAMERGDLEYTCRAQSSTLQAWFDDAVGDYRYKPYTHGYEMYQAFQHAGIYEYRARCKGKGRFLTEEDEEVCWENRVCAKFLEEQPDPEIF